jgi:hypothetical protein
MQSDIQKSSVPRPETAQRIGKALLILGLVVFLVPLIFMGVDLLLIWHGMLPVINSLSSETPSGSPPLPMGHTGNFASWLTAYIVILAPAASLIIMAGAITLAVTRRRAVGPLLNAGDTTGVGH